MRSLESHLAERFAISRRITECLHCRTWLRWGPCMETVFTAIRDSIMRQVILKFVVGHIGGAGGRFDRIVVGPDGYEKNQSRAGAFWGVHRVNSVIQLWVYVQSGLLDQHCNPRGLHSLALRVWRKNRGWMKNAWRALVKKDWHRQCEPKASECTENHS